MDITNQFLDINTIKPKKLDNLNTKSLNEDKALKEVCNDFESYFLNHFLETSLKTSNIAGEGTGSEIIKGMYTDALSRQASGSMGISEMLYKFLSEKKIMITKTIEELKAITLELQDSIKLDIEDVKAARHEELLERNDVKLSSMEKLSSLKQQLNNELSEEFSKGNDVSLYRDSIDELERELKHLYYLNGKLAAIVLPVKEMYKEIIDEITAANGGRLVEVMA